MLRWCGSCTVNRTATPAEHSAAQACVSHRNHTGDRHTVLWPRNAFPGTVYATRLLLAVAAATLALPGTARGQHDVSGVRANVEDWWETAANVAPGNWGIAIADEQGNMIWSVAPNEPLVPASTVKLFTTGFARSVLGGDATRSTRLVGSGWIAPETGTWVGPWALELNGDVTLGRGSAGGPRARRR